MALVHMNLWIDGSGSEAVGRRHGEGQCRRKCLVLFVLGYYFGEMQDVLCDTVLWFPNLDLRAVTHMPYFNDD
jgi:hypothetical protein